MSWRRDFSSPGKRRLDQAGDDGAIAEGALHQRGFGEPFLEVVAQHVLVEKLRERELAAPDAQIEIAQAPHGERIFIGDKAERPHAAPAQAGA